MATSPVAMMLVAWALLAQRPRLLGLAGATLGLVGVAAMLLPGGAGVSAVGVLASVTAMLMSEPRLRAGHAGGGAGVDVVSSTAWQLVAGGLVLLPFAVAVEGGPPALDGRALLGFAYVSFVATAVAYLAWFTGLRHLPAGTVGLLGLLNPIVGVLLGVAVRGRAAHRGAGAGRAGGARRGAPRPALPPGVGRPTPRPRQCGGGPRRGGACRVAMNHEPS